MRAPSSRCLTFLAASTLSLCAAAAPVDPRDYPALDREQLGHLNHFARLALQPAGEWGDMGIQSVSQEGDDGYRYQMAFMSYILGAVQADQVPAYRELYQRMIGSFVEKMKRREVWSYWEDISAGKAWDGQVTDDQKAQGKISDPIARDNIMYSGHVLQMAALYEMLYRDGRYDQPGSFTLKDLTSSGFRTYVYDLPKVAQVVKSGFDATGGYGVACQVNKIFPSSCNQYPIMGFLHYDATHGTALAPEVIAAHRKAWQQISSLYRTDAAMPTPTPFIMRWRQQDLMSANLFTLATSPWIRTWDRDYIDTRYPEWRKTLLQVKTDDVALAMQMPQFATVKGEPVKPWGGYEAPYDGVGPEENGATPAMQHVLALGAAELGDEELRKAALAFADRHNPPVWRDGEFYYERHDANRFAPDNMTRLGAIFLAGGRLLRKDALYNLYNHPWGAAELAYPEVRGIEHPKVLVSRAQYDPKADALVLTLLPGALLMDPKAPAIDTRFSIVRLDPAKDYGIWRDSHRIARLNKGHLEDVAKGAQLAFHDGVLEVATRLDGTRSFVVQSAATSVASADLH